VKTANSKSERNRSKCAAAQWLAEQQGLRPWEEVARLWNERSGEHIGRARVMQIAKSAEAKLKGLLAC
jgi:hypothetical protein